MQLTIEIPDNKASFFKELVGQLGFKVKIKEEKLTEKQVFEGLKASWEEICLHEKGEIELPLAKEILHEL